MSTPLAAFGPGILIISRTDVTPQVPINVGFAQELSIDYAGNTKQLFGQNQFPLVAARGTVKATGKWKAAVLSAFAWNSAFFGATLSTSNTLQWNVGSTITLSTASTAAVQVGSSLTFDTDLGITYVNTGLPFQRVTTGSEAAGKYSITTGSPGLYNFAAADTTGGGTGGTPIKVTYTNTTSASGQNIPLVNQPIGFTPTFQLDYYTSLNQPTAKPFVVRVYACVASKVTWAAKLEDFIQPEFDFDIFADNSGRVFNQSYPEIS